MKKFVIILIAAVLICLAVGYCFFQANFLVVDRNVFPRDIAQVDLSGTKLANPEALAQLTNLVRLDLRDTDITQEQYQYLAQKLPNCQISWSVPFQGQYYSNDTTSLHTKQLTQADVSLLAYFPNLTYVDATDCTDLAVIRALREAYPQVFIGYWVPLDGNALAPDTTALTLGSGTTEDLADALSCLPLVREVDAYGCQDYAALQALQAQYPQCIFHYQVSIAGQKLEHTAKALTIQDPNLNELAAVLPYLPQLETITLTGTLPSNEEIHQLQVEYPNVCFVWSFNLCGLEVSTLDSIIDLSNIPMKSTQAVESALPYFYDLERVIMCDCGISNEEMDALGKRNPDIRFVWTVSIGPMVRLRTDATYFMPHQYGAYLTDSHTENLKYCIDLICIDLGHMKVSDVSFLAYMPHMKYLLIAISPVADISAVAGMQELEYAELFTTNIQDYSPLLSCPNLKDLNICYATPEDCSVLAQLTQLENLYIKEWTPLPYLEELKQALPHVNIVNRSIESSSSTADGWRKLPRYYAMRDLLGMPYLKG